MYLSLFLYMFRYLFINLFIFFLFTFLFLQLYFHELNSCHKNCSLLTDPVTYFTVSSSTQFPAFTDYPQVMSRHGFISSLLTCTNYLQVRMIHRYCYYFFPSLYIAVLYFLICELLKIMNRFFFCKRFPLGLK